MDGASSSNLLSMDTVDRIYAYFESLSGARRDELRALHELILRIEPACKLWFFDGTNEEGKVVANPSAGYGSYKIKYADGTAKDFYRVGLSSNTGGISVYIMGWEDKNHLPSTYGATIGKAKVTGYCIKFKSLKDIDVNVVELAIRERLGAEA